MNTIRQIDDCRPDTVTERVRAETEPLVLKGLVSEWPIVAAGRQSPQAAADYIRRFYSGDRVTAFSRPRKCGVGLAITKT